MILQSQNVFVVILVVKLKQYHYQEPLHWQYWISSYCRWCCNDSKDFRRYDSAADIAADAVTTAKILDGTILAADTATDAVTNIKMQMLT
jgi:hypothetical protein